MQVDGEREMSLSPGYMGKLLSFLLSGELGGVISEYRNIP
jgi:hypothetical protein